MLVAQLRELLLDLDDLLANGDQFALVVLPAHLVLLELPQQRLELVPLEPVLLERVLELVVGVPELEDLPLVLLGLLVDALDLRLVLLYQLQVVPRYLVVVILQLSEGLLVVLHQLVYMQVLPLLELMDLHSLLQL